jgi:hypothetical protein
MLNHLSTGALQIGYQKGKLDRNLVLVVTPRNMGNNSSQEVREFPSHDLARRDQPLPIMVTANQRTVAAKTAGFGHGVSSMLSPEVSKMTFIYQSARLKLPAYCFCSLKAFQLCTQ